LTTLYFRNVFKIQHAQKTNKTSSLSLLSENTATLPFSMFFMRANPANAMLIKKVDQLFTSGLVQKFEDDRIPKDLSGKHDDHEVARALTFDHIGVCFAIIMICLGLSCIVFVVECSVGYFR
jgi:hypothetical protein